MGTVAKFLAFPIALLALCAGCGGGSGGGQAGDPLETIPYTGATAQAVVTASNAETLALEAFLGAGIGGDPTGALLRDGQARRSGESRPSFVVLAGEVADLIRNGRAAPARAAAPRAIRSDVEVTPGRHGGSVTVSTNVDDVTGSFSGTCAFRDFNDDGLSVLDGDVAFSGTIDLDTLAFLRLDMAFRLFRVATPSGGTTISGTYSDSPSATPRTALLNLRVRDDESGAVTWVDGYAVSTVPGFDHDNVTIAGRFYDPAIGCVSVATLQPVRTWAGNDTPSAGRIRVTGGRGAAELAFLTAAAHRTWADADDDGAFEHAGLPVHWPGLDTIPVADAGADRIGTVAVPIALDGSGSFDADGDALACAWSFDSRPEGSAAQLLDSDGLSPRFTPDLEGSYVVRLVVDDGLAPGVADTVTITVGAIDLGPVFGTAAAVATGSSAETVAIGDVDGDGRNDVVLCTTYYFDEANDHKLFVFLQGSGGALLPPVRYATRATYTTRPASVAIGDVDADGRNEVLVAEHGAGIERFARDDAGGLVSTGFIPTANSNKIRIADLNHDGRMDVVGIGWGTNSADVLIQDSAGALRPPVTYAVTHGGWDDLDTGDVNHDGLTDIIVMSGQMWLPNLGILYQLPGGGFSAPVYLSVASPVSAQTLTRGVAVGDVTGDGRADVVVTYGGISPNGRVGVFAQDGSGALGAVTPYASIDIPGPVEVADVNGDGKQDVVVLHGGWNTLGTYLQKPDGALASEIRAATLEASGTNSHRMALGDVDGDGKPDAVIADPNRGLIVLPNAR